MLLIVFFLFWEGDSCSSSFFVLGGRSVLLIVVCFGREIRVANRFFVLGGGSVFLIVFLLWEGCPCCPSFYFSVL